MWRCKVINFLFKAVPIKVFQGYLVISHIKTCSACQSRLANREEAQSFLIPRAELQNGKDFWPNVRHAIEKKQSPLKSALVYRWRWAFMATLTIGSILAGIWFLFTPTLQKSPEPTQKFHVNYIEIENKPAQAFYFKTAVKAQGLIKPPGVLKKVDPHYPKEARKLGQSGVVILNVRADEEGKIEGALVLRSLGEILDKAAIDAVKQWEYEPYVLEGKPRKLVFTVTVRFKLK